MGTADNYCLRWNDFESNICAAFRDLRNDDDFYDVTLACNAENSSTSQSTQHKFLTDVHHRSVRAHKVILSACSPYFRDLLRGLVRTPSVDPLIFLRGVRFQDLVSILDFMYYGEVNIAQDKLNAFLSLAEEFQVKGLTHKKSTKGIKQSESSATNLESSRIQGTSGCKRQRLTKEASSTYFSNETSHVDKNCVKKENPSNIPISGIQSIIDQEVDSAQTLGSKKFEYNNDGTKNPQDYMSPVGSNGHGVSNAALGHSENDKDTLQHISQAFPVDRHIEDGNSLDYEIGSGSNLNRREYKAKIRKLIKHDPSTGLYHCLLCNQTSKQSTIISNHLEARHLQMMQYQCEYCGKEFSTRVHRNVHIHRVHKEEHKIAKVFKEPGNSASGEVLGENNVFCN